MIEPSKQILGCIVGLLIVLAIKVDGQRLNHAIRAYENALHNKDAISLVSYTQAARELQGIIKKFGKLFSFADGEFGKMITGLERVGFSPDGQHNAAYESIQSAVEFEIKENIIKSKKASATRGVADLQWAMRWLSNFMQKLSLLDDNDGTSGAARRAYSEIFHKKHPWPVRTAVGFALRTLPKKRNLVQKIMDDDPECANNEELRNSKIAKFASITDELIVQLNKFYAEKNLQRM